MRCKCRKCGDTIEVTRPREFKSCKCGAINLDYGDEFYFRVGGNPEDFDGEIEGAPKVQEPVKPSEICNLSSISYNPEFTKVDSFWVEMAEHFKAMGKLCEEKSEEATSK